MFNNWLKRRDEGSDKEESEVKDEEMNTSKDFYDGDNEDDYYYYYYYEADSHNGPTIPNLSSEPKEEELEYYDSKDETYVSPFGTQAASVENEQENSSDFSYEEDHVEPTIESLTQDPGKITLLENEASQLRDRLSELESENNILRDQARNALVVEEKNQQLSEQLEAQDRLLEENNELKIRLLDFEKAAEASQIESDRLNELDEEISKLTQDNETKELANNDLIEKINTLEAEKSELETANGQLREDLEKSTNLIETLKSENTVFVTKIEELQATIEELEKESSEESLIIEENKRMIKELEEELEESNNQNQLEKEANLKRISELESELASAVSKEDETEASLIIEENKRMIKELEEELDQSKALETELIKRYETEIENNKIEMKKNEQELTEMNERISQTEELEKELAELRENQKAIQELQQELSSMRNQQAEVTTSLTELASEKSRAARLEQEVSELKATQTPEVSELQGELARVKEELRLANLRADQGSSMNQSDIAHVMLEAQAKARQIVDVANYEAKRRVADSEMELSAVSQEARNYYRKLEKIKAESEVVFAELLRKLESIGDIDRL